jgi:hypothetical protein
MQNSKENFWVIPCEFSGKACENAFSKPPEFFNWEFKRYSPLNFISHCTAATTVKPEYDDKQLCSFFTYVPTIDVTIDAPN